MFKTTKINRNNLNELIINNEGIVLKIIGSKKDKQQRMLTENVNLKYLKPLCIQLSRMRQKM